MPTMTCIQLNLSVKDIHVNYDMYPTKLFTLLILAIEHVNYDMYPSNLVNCEIS